MAYRRAPTASESLKTISGPIVTNTARGVAGVRALVHVGAYVPDQGESIATVLDPAAYPGSLLGKDTTDVRPVSNPVAPGGPDADLSIKPADFRSVFAADVPTRTAARMAVARRPLSLTAGTQVSGAPAWKTIPSGNLITFNDEAIPPVASGEWRDGRMLMSRPSTRRTR